MHCPKLSKLFASQRTGKPLWPSLSISASHEAVFAMIRPPWKDVAENDIGQRRPSRFDEKHSSGASVVMLTPLFQFWNEGKTPPRHLLDKGKSPMILEMSVCLPSFRCCCRRRRFQTAQVSLISLAALTRSRRIPRSRAFHTRQTARSNKPSWRARCLAARCSKT